MDHLLASSLTIASTSRGLSEVALRFSAPGLCVSSHKCFFRRFKSSSPLFSSLGSSSASLSKIYRRRLHSIPPINPTSYLGGSTFILPPSAGTTSAVSQRFKEDFLSVSTMAGMKIDGTAIAKKIRDRLKNTINEMREMEPTFSPTLTIIQGLHASIQRPLR